MCSKPTDIVRGFAQAIYRAEPAVVQKKRGRVEWDRYWHEPLALLRLKLEAVPAEVRHSAFRVVCKHDVMSNWKFRLAGGLRRHLSSVKHRKNLHWLLCDCPEFHHVST